MARLRRIISVGSEGEYAGSRPAITSESRRPTAGAAGSQRKVRTIMKSIAWENQSGRQNYYAEDQGEHAPCPEADGILRLNTLPL
jgi:hypothetical protein